MRDVGAVPLRSLDDAVAIARDAVGTWFPTARAAWLGGSVVRGTATASSDLDITVLLDGPPAPFRDTRRHDGWPVELFVQTDGSLAHYRGTDQARRQPTLARLVGESVVLVDRDGSGERLRHECLVEIAAGPTPLAAAEIDAMRYALTCLLDDLGDLGAVDDLGDPGDDADLTARPERTAVAVATWEAALRLLLGVHRHWTGTGKGLAREVRALDTARGASSGSDFDDALRAALDGDPAALLARAGAVLDLAGGRLFEGYRVGGKG